MAAAPALCPLHFHRLFDGGRPPLPGSCVRARVCVYKMVLTQSCMIYSRRTEIARIVGLLLQVVLEQAGISPSGTLEPVQLLQATPNPFLCPRNEKSGEAGYDLPSFGNGFLYGAFPRREPGERAAAAAEESS